MKMQLPSLSTFIFSAVAFLSHEVQSQSHSSVRIVTEPFHPYNFQFMGEARGMSTEVVQAMLAHAGIEADIEFFPWPRAYQYALQQPNTLIFSIARIPERESLFTWIGTVAPYKTSFYKLKSRTDLKINSLNDARLQSVGVSQADVIYTYLKNSGFQNLEVARADTIALNMLAYRRIDLIALAEEGLSGYLQDADIKANEIERVFRIQDLSGELYVAIQPDSDKDLIDKLKVSLEHIKLDGTYDAIRARWSKYQ